MRVPCFDAWQRIVAVIGIGGLLVVQNLMALVAVVSWRRADAAMRAGV